MKDTIENRLKFAERTVEVMPNGMTHMEIPAELCPPEPGWSVFEEKSGRSWMTFAGGEHVDFYGPFRKKETV